MKKNKLIILLQATILPLTLAACGNNSNNQPSSSASANVSTSVSENKVEKEMVTVTFDLNYENSPAATTATTEAGDIVDEPANPTREHYTFTYWYSDAACTHKFDFEEALDTDVTAYAGWTQVEAVVTFDENYEGGLSTESIVAIQGTVDRITSPVRDGYNFTDWYSDVECTTVYDFASAVTADMTLFAGWAVKSTNDVTLTYYWNYEDAPNNGVAYTKVIEKKTKTTSYKTTRDGYYLAGWYTDVDCTTPFDFSSRINEDINLYAKWLKENTFEAEYVDLTGINGSTYSGGGGGTAMIKKDFVGDGVGSDTRNYIGASNNYYVSDMYLNGCALTFNINSAEAVEDAILVLRLGAEYLDITFSCTDYLVQVNGTNLTYSDISFTNVPAYDTGMKKEFTNITISNSVALNKGENVIKIIVNNDRKMQDSGTLYATAPMIDCLYLYTNTELTWVPKTENLDNKL